MENLHVFGLIIRSKSEQDTYAACMCVDIHRTYEQKQTLDTFDYLNAMKTIENRNNQATKDENTH